MSKKDNTLYYGSSKDPERRLAQCHNAGQEEYTSKKIPWKLVYKERFTTRSEAVRREKFFKSGKGREYIKQILKHNLHLTA